jgi:hypothetical protein
MYWEIEIPLIVRNLINDFGSPPTYSDSRLEQLCVVAAQYVAMDVKLDKNYVISVVETKISPDPSDPATRDMDFIGFIALKAACLLDQTTYRTKAVNEGVRTSLGSASLSISGNLDGYKTLLHEGPCAHYDNLTEHWDVAKGIGCSAVLSPFVGNKFDPRSLLRGPYRSMFNNDMYS